ncbi:hypothetical protein [Corynebacterium sanguinis]|uniref:hypothetical protein n=1 Tax=Corynebacterium sanguinis TaxID=2594913 RepID=UPI0011A0049C|nr:hypothetical protein [Corynebacterium sanguinis]MCT1805697.1 hypothetical protein [Corynebacterium sanguinis]MCT2158016.1 hypothetical protein [Corynebacterium sanguinis]MDN8577778.1 hypothetical protein [Corynebacterium sanguinis]TVS28293.1 hypothetical protein EKI56_00510 [Corynebacterium sanguinis]
MNAAPKQNVVERLTGAVKNRVMTYAQVRYPALAGSVVRSITSGGSKKKKATNTGSQGDVVKQAAPQGRYAPQGNGRTNGIVAAQAAAAPLTYPSYGRGTR